MVASQTAALGTAEAKAPAAAAPVALSVKLGGTKTIDASSVSVSLAWSPEAEALADKTGDQPAPWRLPHGSVRVSGRTVSLVLDPKVVPDRLVTDQGLVHVNVHASAGNSRQVFYAGHSVMRAKVKGQVVWVDPLLPGAPNRAKTPVLKFRDLGVEPLSPGFAGIAAAAQSTVPVVTAKPIEVNAKRAKILAAIRSSPSAQQAEEGTNGCPPGTWAYNTKKTKKRWSTVGSSYPLKSSTSWLTYTSSTKTSYGYAVSVAGGAFTESSGSKSVEDDWGQNFGQKNFDRAFRVRIKYRLYKCLGPRIIGSPEHSRIWSPIETNGIDDAKLKGGPPADWKECNPIGTGEWYRGESRGTDYSNSAGVKFKGIIGIDLSTQRAYVNGSRLYYSNPKKRKVCYRTGNPFTAPKLRERPRRWKK